MPSSPWIRLRLVVALTCLMAAVSVPASLALARQDEDKRPPNVVLFYADDLGYGDLGCFGAMGHVTPNLDRMAAEGRKFTSFYVATAVCSASRSALLTGCYHRRVGIEGALNPQARNGIHPDETTMAEMFRGRGYATAIFGKWHLGHHAVFLPTRHGFDEYHGLPYSNDMSPRPANNPNPNSATPELPLMENETVIEREPDQSRLTGEATRRAVAFLERNKEKGKPFFLYMPYSMPHVPLYASKDFKGKQPQGLFGDVVNEIDASVGTIRATLERLGLTNDTLLVFASDNGPWLTFGDHAGRAGGLREGKGTAFEGGVRVPALAVWPGHIPPASLCAEPLMTIDLLPTFARLIGAPLPDRKLDGMDVWPLFIGGPEVKSPQNAYFFWFDSELRAVRSGRYKLVFPHVSRAQLGPAGTGGKPAGQGTLVVSQALYDLIDDPGETRDVAVHHPDIVQRLEALADSARRALGDKLRGVTGEEIRPSARLEDFPKQTP